LTGTAISAGFNAGDRLAFVGRIKSANCEASAMEFDVAMQFNPGAASTYPICHWAVDIGDGQMVCRGDGSCRSHFRFARDHAEQRHGLGNTWTDRFDQPDTTGF
jgi:hypothetical protein